MYTYCSCALYDDCICSICSLNDECTYSNCALYDVTADVHWMNSVLTAAAQWMNSVLTAAVHWMTSRQLSSPALSLKSSPALLSSHNLASCDRASSSWHSNPAKCRRYTTLKCQEKQLDQCSTPIKISF